MWENNMLQNNKKINLHNAPNHDAINDYFDPTKND